MAKKKLLPRGPQLDLAGDLSVAFVNTAGARKKNRQQGIGSYAELLIWSQQAGILLTAEAEGLTASAAARPEAAAEALALALRVRGALSGLFGAQQMGRERPASDLRMVNDALSAALPAARLVPGEKGLVWGWAGDREAFDRMLWPVLHAAADLLISTEGRPEVRQCALSGCRLFFVDRSRSRQRHWCEMKACGSRAKSLRFYRKSGKARRERSTWGIGAFTVKRPRPSSQKL